MKKITEILAYYSLPLLLVALSIWYPNNGETFSLMGEAAEILLVFLLFISPLAKIFPLTPIRKLMPYRRQIGVATFWLALFHAGGLIASWELYYLSWYFDPNDHFLYGLIALIGMIILGVTSNNISFRFFQKNWKKIQYLAYPTLFFTLLHSSMASGEMEKFFVVGGVYVVLKVMEWKGVKVQIK